MFTCLPVELTSYSRQVLISLKCAYANDYCETTLRTILLLTLLNKTETCLKKNVLTIMQILCNCPRPIHFNKSLFCFICLSAKMPDHFGLFGSYVILF